MEQIFKNQTSLEKSQEQTLQNVIRELSFIKDENLKKKEKGEKYDINFIDLNINLIGPEEVMLWEDLKSIHTKDDWKRVSSEFEEYRKKTVAEIQQERQKGFKDIIHPKDEFIGLFGNQLEHFSSDIKELN